MRRKMFANPQLIWWLSLKICPCSSFESYKTNTTLSWHLLCAYVMLEVLNLSVLSVLCTCYVHNYLSFPLVIFLSPQPRRRARWSSSGRESRGWQPLASCRVLGWTSRFWKPGYEFLCYFISVFVYVLLISLIKIKLYILILIGSFWGSLPSCT